MTLEMLLRGIKVLDTNVKGDFDVLDIKINSQQVTDGDVFVCMRGAKTDGNAYLNDLSCDFVTITEVANQNVKYVQVENARQAYAIMCANFFSRPLQDMKFISIVGTNGKTSTAHYVNSLLAHCGYKTGLIGTEGHYILGEKVGCSLTTPDPYELYSLLFRMRAKGVDVVISEVSAHAIYLEKLYGITADISVFTNFSHDHLDYFRTIDNYQDVKLSYFNSNNVKTAIVNVDDETGRLLVKKLENSGVEVITYGLDNPCDCFAIDVFAAIDGLRFVANLNDDLVDVRSNLYGEFNAYNLLAALSVCNRLGLRGEILALAVRKVKGVKGRFSVLRVEKGDIIIDYAHTPEGLRQLLITARSLTKSRLITVFGCGGERDTGKRAEMAVIAEGYSDFVVVTTDNPRGENANAILRDIEKGFSKKDYKVIADRADAIAYAIGEMLEGDTVVIAGKGSESYLEIKGKKIPYSDFDVVKRFGQAR